VSLYGLSKLTTIDANLFKEAFLKAQQENEALTGTKTSDAPPVEAETEKEAEE
jgi:hypothetical protein